MAAISRCVGANRRSVAEARAKTTGRSRNLSHPEGVAELNQILLLKRHTRFVQHLPQLIQIINLPMMLFLRCDVLPHSIPIVGTRAEDRVPFLPCKHSIDMISCPRCCCLLD